MPRESMPTPRGPVTSVQPAQPPGVTFVVPVRNGARWLDAVIAAIRTQVYGGAIDVVVVEDGSTDDSPRILRRHARAGRLVTIAGPRRGAAAALNAGMAAATQPLIAQVDQDVVIQPDWLRRLVRVLEDDESVGAVQGRYEAAPGAGLWSRVMALDLTQRYAWLASGQTSHVCSGNSVYRRAALARAGPFDEQLGYGYDNDMSYRLAQAGYALAICPEARSVHHWREGPLDYLRQQYGFGYGRLDLVAKHRRRLAGDSVSPVRMMAHAPGMAVAVGAALVAAVLALAGRPAIVPAVVAAVLFAALAGERLFTGLLAGMRYRDWSGLWFLPIHLLRDLAWVAAIAVWLVRRASGTAPRPADSMRPRDPAAGVMDRGGR
jgi:Glycosyl transferase family 2